MSEILWQPSEESIAQSNLSAFQSFLKKDGHQFNHYSDLHKFSVDHPSLFWKYLWDYGSFLSSSPIESILTQTGGIQSAKWFTGCTLNFAENLLRYRDDRIALVGYDERGKQKQLSYSELYCEVSKVSRWLKEKGVEKGDRVVGFMPNIIETVVAMLATTSLGAVWSSCSPDFGIQGVLDRFGQIKPKILFTTDGYIYNGKHLDNIERVANILSDLSSIEQVVVIPHLDNAMHESALKQHTAMASTPFTLMEELLTSNSTELSFTPVPFDHPLYILYSSGTTGAPKCIVHATGGTLLQHYKELSLHTNVGDNDSIFYYTTCGWMMWNWLVSSLMTGAKVVLFDGSPFAPSPSILWDIADQESISVFGTSAKYIAAMEKQNVKPKKTHTLSKLKSVLSTGSPLAHESFDFVYQNIKKDLCLSSISGGTDIISCFALGCSVLPVYRGEIQCIGLGMDVQVFDESGEPIYHNDQADGRGELVCKTAFPSMPIGFWSDADGSKYRKAYFERFKGIWAHGDYAELIPHDTQMGVTIHGRSDAVLNPGGVRIGTAEIYRQVEKVNDVLEAIAVGQQWEGDIRVILFVVLRDGTLLDQDLVTQIKSIIRINSTPRHVPAKIVQVPDIPRTISGKIVELAVRNVIHGKPVRNTDALKNPKALDCFKNIPDLQEP